MSKMSNFNVMLCRWSRQQGVRSTSTIGILVFLLAALLVLPSCTGDDDDGGSTMSSECESGVDKLPFLPNGDCPLLTEEEGKQNYQGGDSPEAIKGTGGDDTLSGGGGDDTLFGLGGDDTLFGEAGDDTLYGMDGNDTVRYQALEGVNIDLGAAGGVVDDGSGGEDTISGVENVECVPTYDYDDAGTRMETPVSITLTGDDEDNILIGCAGDDTLSGGAGDDTLQGKGGVDILDGGPGSDTASYVDSEDPVKFSLLDSPDTDGYIEVPIIGDKIKNIENITGSPGKDMITGDAGPNVLNGGDGIDRLNGGDGDDTLNGGDGDDILNGGDGDDTLNGGAGSMDTFDGGDGDDTYTIDAGEVITEITADQAGTDSMIEGGMDTVIYSPGVDMTDPANPVPTGVTATVANNVETAFGTEHADMITASANNGTTIIGCGGMDTLTGGTGMDVFGIVMGDEVMITGLGDGDEVHLKGFAGTIGIGIDATNVVITVSSTSTDADGMEVTNTETVATVTTSTAFATPAELETYLKGQNSNMEDRVRDADFDTAKCMQ